MNSITALIKEYKSQKYIGFHEIMDFRVKFDRIRPFEDCNGLGGSLLISKEYFRHNTAPFIIDYKCRTGYLEGIRCWDKAHSISLWMAVWKIRCASRLKLLYSDC